MEYFKKTVNIYYDVCGNFEKEDKVGWTFLSFELTEVSRKVKENVQGKCGKSNGVFQVGKLLWNLNLVGEN